MKKKNMKKRRLQRLTATLPSHMEQRGRAVGLWQGKGSASVCARLCSGGRTGEAIDSGEVNPRARGGGASAGK